MAGNNLRNKYVPMSETAYYILLSLVQPRHGYGIKQHVRELTGDRLDIGAGTMYSTLSRMEKDKLIIPVKEGLPLTMLYLVYDIILPAKWDLLLE